MYLLYSQEVILREGLPIDETYHMQCEAIFCYHPRDLYRQGGSELKMTHQNETSLITFEGSFCQLLLCLQNQHNESAGK